MLSNRRTNRAKKFTLPTWVLVLSSAILLGFAIWLGTPTAARLLTSIFSRSGDDESLAVQPEVSNGPSILVPDPPAGPAPALPDPELSPILRPLVEALLPSAIDSRSDSQESPDQEQTSAREYYLDFILPQLDGSLQHTRVVRKIPSGPEVKKKLLLALLNGPDPGELSQNLLSLIPTETRLISLDQSGDTLTLNFSEDFQFNSLGAEGYRAQVIQIIQTLKQFPDVKKVQFLIEGRRISTLGEVIPIGQPISIDRFP